MPHAGDQASRRLIDRLKDQRPREPAARVAHDQRPLPLDGPDDEAVVVRQCR